MKLFQKQTERQSNALQYQNVLSQVENGLLWRADTSHHWLHILIVHVWRRWVMRWLHCVKWMKPYLNQVQYVFLPSHWKCGRLCFDRRVFIYLYACYSHNSKSIKPNRMKCGGMNGYYPGTIWLDFGIDRVKGQGQGYEKVKIFFLP